ncbi:MAG: PorT family protein [Bacteroidales bacterium]|nr:PorT family protein [Bacteroidales bacterium]
MNKGLLIVFLLIINVLCIKAQQFNGGFAFGVAGTQISGDELGGFNKAGPYVGIFSNLNISGKTSLQLEIDFIQKGSRKNIGKSDNTIDTRYVYRLRLNYIEIPLTFKYDIRNVRNFKDSSNQFMHQLNFLTVEFGLCFARLLKFSESDLYGEIEPRISFNDYDCSALCGLYYSINKNLKMNLRYMLSVIPVRKHSSEAHNRLNHGQYNELLVLSLHYQFNKANE